MKRCSKRIRRAMGVIRGATKDRSRGSFASLCVFEGLEQRILLGGDPFINASGTLVVPGTGDADTVIVELAGPQLLVTLNGQAFGFDKLLVNDIFVDTMGGVDLISIDAAIDVATVVDGGNDPGVDDHLTIVGTPVRDRFDIGAFEVRGRGATPTDVSFTNINFVNVLGMGGSDAFFITPSLIAIAIDGGMGDDEVTIHAGGEVSSVSAGPPLSVTVGSFTPVELESAENIVVRNAPFSVGNAAAIDVGLSELVAWAQRLEGFGVFGVNAPVSTTTHGELLGLSSVLEQLRLDLGEFLRDPGTPSPPTSADILSFLDTWSAAPAPGLSVSAVTTSSGFYIDPGAVVRPLVSLRMQVLSTTTVSLADAPGLVATGIAFDPSALVTLTTALDMDFSFGAGVGAFFAEFVDMSITQSADASGVAAGTPVTIGILGATVSNPLVSLDGAIDVVARQADEWQRISLAQLQGDLSQLLSISANGTLSGGFDVTPDPTGFEPGMVPPNGQISIGRDVDNYYEFPAGISVDVSTPLIGFLNASPEDLLAPLLRFEEWLVALQQSPIYSHDLPFVDAVSLGDLLNFSDVLNAKLTGSLITGSGAPAFTTIQEILIPTAVGGVRFVVEFDQGTLRFKASISGQSGSSSRPIVLNLDRVAGDVSGATNIAQQPIEITTSSPHGLSSGDRVSISGVRGVRLANGTFTVTVTAPDRFVLQGAEGEGRTSYSNGGRWFLATLHPWQLLETTAQASLTGDVNLELRYNLELAGVHEATITAPLWTNVDQGWRLASDAAFTVQVGSQDAVRVLLDHTVTSANTTLAELVANVRDAIESALTAAGQQASSITVDSFMFQIAPGVELPKLRLTKTSGGTITITSPNNIARDRLGLIDGPWGESTAGFVETAAQVTLTGPLEFELVIDDSSGTLGTPVQVVVTPTSLTQSVSDLVSDINAALQLAGLGAVVVAERALISPTEQDSLRGNRVQFRLLDESLQIRLVTASGDEMETVLGFVNGQTGRADGVAAGYFLENTTSVSGIVRLAYETTAGSGRFGFFDITIGSASAQGAIDIDVTLKDPALALGQTPDGRIQLVDFSNKAIGVSDLINTPQFGGKLGDTNHPFLNGQIAGAVSGDLQFVLALDSTVTNKDDVLGIIVSMSDITVDRLAEMSLSGPSVDLLRSMSIDDALSMLVPAAGLIDLMLEDALLGVEIPFLGVSGGELNQIADQFRSFTASLAAAGALTIQALEQEMRGRLGVTGSSVAFEISGNSVVLTLPFEHSETANAPLIIDLPYLGERLVGGFPVTLDRQSKLVDGGRLVVIDVATDASLSLVVGATFDALGQVSILVDQATTLRLGLRVDESGLEFDALYGPVELFARGGRLLVTGPGGSMSYDIDLVAGGTYGSFQSSDVSAAVLGSGEIVIPLFRPRQSAFGTIGLRIDNMAAAMRDPAEMSVFATAAIPDLKALTSATNNLAFLLRNPGELITGIDRFLENIELAMQAAVDVLDLPLIGDGLTDVFQPFVDVITRIRSEFRALVTRVMGDAPGSATLPDLITLFQGALFNLFGPDDPGAPGPRLGILQDRPDDGNNIVDLNDILFSQGITENVVQWDMLLGESLKIEKFIPFAFGFQVADLGLDRLLPNFGFSVDATGLTIDLHWNINLGIGLSTEDGVYFNASGKDAQGNPIVFAMNEKGEPLDEIRLGADISIPGFEQRIALGLLTTETTDGTTSRARVQSLDGFEITDLKSGDELRVILTKKNGSEETIDLKLSSIGGGPIERLIAMLLQFNPNPVFSSLIVTPNLAPAFADLFVSKVDPNDPNLVTPTVSVRFDELMIGLVLTSRDPEVVSIRVEGGEEFGFADGQFEDQRGIGLGFDDGQTGTGLLTGDRAVPVDGRLLMDTDFTLKVDGTGVSIKMRTLQLDDVKTRRDLLDAFRLVLQNALGEAGLAIDAVTVDLTGAGEFEFSAKDPTASLEVSVDMLERSSLKLSLSLDAKGVNNEDRLTLRDMASGSPLAILTPGMKADARLRLNVRTSLDTITDFIEGVIGFDGLGLPNITFDLKIDASPFLKKAEGKKKPAPSLRIDKFQFDNIVMDAGEFIKSLAGPIVEGINEVLGPFLDLFGDAASGAESFLTSDLPLLDDLGIHVSMADLADQLPGSNPLTPMFTMLGSFRSLIDFVQNFSQTLTLNFGCLALDFNESSPFYFPKTKIPIPCELLDLGFAKPDLPVFVSAEFEPGGFKLDVFSLDAVLDLILGNPVDLFSFNLPTTAFQAGLGFDFGWKDFSMRIGGSVYFKTDLGLVYDTTGLQHVIDAQRAGVTPDFADLLDGFYIRNQVGPELSLGAAFGGGASIKIVSPEICLPLVPCIPSITVFAVEASVDVSMSVGIDIKDPNEDGKLRLDEIIEFTNGFQNPENMLLMFDITGRFNLSWDFSATIMGATVSAGSLPFPKDIGINLSAQEFMQQFGFWPTAGDPQLRAVLADRMGKLGDGRLDVLRLNAGPFAEGRIFGDVDDSNNSIHFIIEDGSGNSVIIYSPSLGISRSNARTYSLDEISEIVFIGTDFDDTVEFRNYTKNVKVLFFGGAGNDRFIGGPGDDFIDGGVGDDELDGGKGNDTIFGGAGNDILRGNGGNDTLDGEFGDDTLEGGLGSDLYIFRRGWGNDTVVEIAEIGTVDTLDFTSVSANLFIDLVGNSLTISDFISNSVTHTGLEIEEVLGGRRDDLFTIRSTGPNDIRLAGGFGSDDYHLIFGGTFIGDIIIFDEGFPWDVDRFIVDGTEQDDTLGLTDTELIFTITVNYGVGIEVVLIDTKGGNDTIKIQSTAAPTSYDIKGEKGDDLFRVGVDARTGEPLTLNQILANPLVGKMLLAGEDDTDRIEVYDTLDAAGNTNGVLTDETLTGLGMDEGINYIEFEEFFLELGLGGDIFLVKATHAGTTRIDSSTGDDTINLQTIAGETTVNTEEGSDTINVGSFAPIVGGTTDDIAALLIIDGGEEAGATTDFDTINVDDTGNTTGRRGATAGVLTQTTIRGLGLREGIDYLDFSDPQGRRSTIELLNINLGTGADGFLIKGTLADLTVLDTSDGDDEIDMSSDAPINEGTLDFVLGEIIIRAGDGTNRLSVSDRGDPDADNNVVITSNTITGLAPGNITYEATGNYEAGIRIFGGLGGNTIRIESTRLDAGKLTITRVFAGGGDDRVSTAALAAGSDGVLVIRGESGDDTIDAHEASLGLFIFGDQDNDTITGGTGVDFVFGDEGRVYFLDSGGQTLFVLGGLSDPAHLAGLSPDADKFTPDLAITTLGASDGSDTIEGGASGDVIFGGSGALDQLSGQGGSDLVLGDHGRVVLMNAAPTLTEAMNPTIGGSDEIFGGSGDDVIVAGTGEDVVDAGGGRDIVFGDHGRVDFTLARAENFTSIFTGRSDGGGDDIIRGGADDDVLLGQQGDDLIFGQAGDDDIFGGHNVAGGIDELDATSATNDFLDGGEGADVIVGDNARIVRLSGAAWARFRVLAGEVIYTAGTLNITGASQTDPRGMVAREIELLDHSSTPTAGTFGNDVMAGGAQDDVLFGGLGDDQIRGDGRIDLTGATPTLVSSADPLADGNDYVEGNGGSDVIFGGQGQDDLIGGSSNLFGLTDRSMRPDGADLIFGGDGTDILRNTLGDQSAEGHAADADYILGDNGIIVRLVGTNGSPTGGFLSFAYDDYSPRLTIIPRGIVLLDYQPDGRLTADIGAGDELHGEAGDDVIYGATGDDTLYGEGQDDDLYGNDGDDWMYGGSGRDGMVGDNGQVFTSRNGTAEVLYGVESSKQSNIKTPGGLIRATLFVKGELYKAVELEPFERGGADVMFGGLGDDFMHGGAGNDALSGAEAQAAFYVLSPSARPSLVYDPIATHFTAYDPTNPLAMIPDFFLNFDARDQAGDKIDDGVDYIFGDHGHDWLVGGTNEDRLFGGLDNDLLQADDDLTTAGGANTVPDPPQWADADIVFGGGGLDVLIGNTGHDRLIDWVGEFNSYIVPFSAFGALTITRNANPQLIRFLVDLGAGSGMDTRLVEPNGELGIVRQGDPLWGSQHGKPRDPQPGNVPGVRRDVNGPEAPGGGEFTPLYEYNPDRNESQWLDGIVDSGDDRSGDASNPIQFVRLQPRDDGGHDR